jgi:hypothetical protein
LLCDVEKYSGFTLNGDKSQVAKRMIDPLVKRTNHNNAPPQMQALAFVVEVMVIHW